MNAAVILLHWLVQVASSDLPSPYGVLQAAFGSLKAGLKLTLTSSLPWHTLTRDWLRAVASDIHVQQDAVAFTEFLLQRANIPAFQGTWEAREDTATHALRDSGIMPIRLDLRPDLQTCIDYWHSESTRFLQALRIPPLYCCCSCHVLTRRTRCVSTPRLSFSRRDKPLTCPVLMVLMPLSWYSIVLLACYFIAVLPSMQDITKRFCAPSVRQ